MTSELGGCGKENSADLPRSGKDEATSMAPQAAKQFGKVMFSEVPPEIRRETISSKIVQLQEEMEREDKTLDDLRNRENAAADVKQKTKLRDEMKKLNDRRQALSLLMTQYLTWQESLDNGEQEWEMQDQPATIS
jgi:prophage antirepressor-like protein